MWWTLQEYWAASLDYDRCAHIDTDPGETIHITAGHIKETVFVVDVTKDHFTASVEDNVVDLYVDIRRNHLGRFDC